MTEEWHGETEWFVQNPLIGFFPIPYLTHITVSCNHSVKSITNFNLESTCKFQDNIRSGGETLLSIHYKLHLLIISIAPDHKDK